MRTKRALNIAAFALIVMGLLLKARYLPGGSVCILLAVALMLVSLFTFAIKDNQGSGLSPGLNQLLVGTLALLIVGVIFKLQRWQGASVLAVAGYAMAFVLPVILFVWKGEFKISKQYLITLFTFLVLLLGVMPRNPIARYIGRGWDHPMTGQEVDARQALSPDAIVVPGNDG